MFKKGVAKVRLFRGRIRLVREIFDTTSKGFKAFLGFESRPIFVWLLTVKMGCVAMISVDETGERHTA